MTIDIVTKQDLEDFKTELLNEIRKIVKNKAEQEGKGHKEWVKSHEVLKLLGVSPGKLQNMRINGTIAFTRIGGLMFYKYDDIVKMMEENKHKNPLSARQI